MSTMTAVRLHSPGSLAGLRVDRVDRPSPRPGQALVEVAAVGVNFADLAVALGQYPPFGPLPVILGFEAAGTVREVGDGVDPGLVGTRVTAMAPGAYAEYVVADAATLVPVPPGMDWPVAAAWASQGLTAYGMLRAAHLAGGDTVLVHAAAGGVGSLAVQVARRLGAGTVLGTASTPAKRDLVTRLGADRAIDYTSPDWASEVGPGSVDIVLDLVGGDITHDSLPLLRPATGRIVVGGLSGGPLKLDISSLVGPAVSVVGYSNPSWLAVPGFAAEASAALLGWIASGDVDVIIDRTVALVDAASALEALGARRTAGKVVLLTGATT